MAADSTFWWPNGRPANPKDAEIEELRGALKYFRDHDSFSNAPGDVRDRVRRVLGR